jgi:dTDP-D-glucose 4,6-dehydratase
MKKLRQKRIPKKIAETLEKSKTRKKLMELSYNIDALPLKMRYAVGDIRKELGFNRNITLADIKTIDKTHRWYKKNEREQ